MSGWHWRRAVTVFATALALGSCAGGGYVAETPSMPAARAALRPEYRIFYDALQDYGDWVLIEPLGFVFRPKVDFATWRPYSDGFWAPSDSWGWVWISAESFGWATYHYGTWTFDRFQGWVWVPGVDWGPAWVSWQLADGYAGWSPLGPSVSIGGSFGSGNPPGGLYVFAPLASLASTDLRSHLIPQSDLGVAATTVQPADRVVERDGTPVNLGPELAKIERMTGRPLPRIEFDDLRPAGVPGAAGAASRAEHGVRETVTPPRERATVTTGAGAAIDAARVESTKRAAELATQRARALMNTAAPVPQRVPMLRPAWIRASAEARKQRDRAATPDTTR
jgi:hypothetical protein